MQKYPPLFQRCIHHCFQLFFSLYNRKLHLGNGIRKRGSDVVVLSIFAFAIQDFYDFLNVTSIAHQIQRFKCILGNLACRA